MIQRIQTLWLAIAAAVSLLTIKFSVFSGIVIDSTGLRKWTELTAATNFLLLILTVGVAVTAGIVIFLYRDRKIQLRLSIIALIISLCNLILYYNEVRKFSPEGNYDLTSLFALSIPVFLVLAIMGIYKDEKLIRSADRLR